MFKYHIMFSVSAFGKTAKVEWGDPSAPGNLVGITVDGKAFTLGIAGSIRLM